MAAAVELFPVFARAHLLRTWGGIVDLPATGTPDALAAVLAEQQAPGDLRVPARELVGVLPARPLRAVVRAPWSDAPGLQAAIAALRDGGETVVCALPGHDSEIDEFHCDRELVERAGQWHVQAI